jgi:hypothetical protein
MFYKEIFSAGAVALTLIGFIPYIRLIFKGTTKPHVFSWVIWGLTTTVVFFAILEDEGGVGAWPIAISGCITLFIALLAFLKRGDISITRSDQFFFVSALSSLPLWYLTSDPLWAVILLTIVDLLGFGPTVRKTYHHPHSESILFFLLFTARNLLVVFALENHTITTVLFPATIAIACTGLIAMMVYKRQPTGCM